MVHNGDRGTCAEKSAEELSDVLRLRERPCEHGQMKKHEDGIFSDAVAVLPHQLRLI